VSYGHATDARIDCDVLDIYWIEALFSKKYYVLAYD